MFCTKCGSQVGSDVKFCPICGSELGGELPAATPWTAPPGITAQTGKWISEGWRIVMDDLGIFMLLALVFVFLSGVPLIYGPLMAGFHIYCMKRMMGKQAEFGDLFKGFNYFVPTLVASLLIGLFVFGGTLLCIIPGLVVAAVYKFTYLFIVDKKMDFWPAMQSSHAVAKNDYFGFTIFLLALAGIDILGALLCVVGLLIAMPLTVAAITCAYRDIVGFDERSVESL